jgi:hypothetical protein
MKKKHDISLNSKGAPFFKKMIEDQKIIHEHIRKGGKLKDLKGDFKFYKPLFIKEE